ncbi:M14 family metallopeptidase [Nocardioides euryhalodurans]|uniref:M14 family metallopeptidase n=1 Tax=Nocardioides euryhalodurans TaxID=2518370 RepID=UPI001ABEC050|nr:M14 family metallopeptidase [Nocardioides euryhalodurans]
MSIGRTVNQQDIIALKISKNAARQKDGRKPSVLYLGAQHAREWITPEMNRRLATYLLDGYGSDPAITRLLNENELWFVPVANPDGYDFTFTPGQRLWRKNLRDNNGDGVITTADGVDLNRNFATKWGYDNEGSSPNPASQTFRGEGPNSEPESQALEDFVGRVGFEFFVNYHSAAELLLYGTGWQVATPTPDDVIYEAMAGDDENPAVPGYDPDISAELYTTNGDTDTHMTELFGTLGFTPEMSTCEAASDSVPDDEWEAVDCGSGFEFPDDEELVQAEFEKNIPFALSVAESASDPDDPVSTLGLTAEDFRVDSFDVSYGDPQTVAVWAKRALRNLRMHYRVDGGRTVVTNAPEWAGGERYGDENDDYYAEFRGRVRGADEGDEVEVWFRGVKPGTGPVTSESFTYTVEADTDDDVLVIANEDYTGVNPTYPAGTDAPKYAGAHVAAIESAGYSTDVWDVDAQGVPHDLGVLDHYDAVLWYLGDNRITMDPEDLLTSTPFGQLPDISVAERQQYLTLAVRDYLNAGGKLVHAGETAQYQGLPGISDAVGGLYYGLNGDPEAECVISPRVGGGTDGFFEDCLILADDFRQYYLGAFTRTDIADPTAVEGIADPLTGYTGSLGGPVVAGDNPLDEAGALQPTSDVLPADEFPQFTSQGAARYPLEAGSPFAPIEGEQYAGAVHADSSYVRLTRTVDVPAGTTAAELQFQLSANIEPDYDFVLVEARTAGGDDWTTLPELSGLTSTASPAECVDEGSFLLALHPFLTTYLGTDCQGTGATGDWNAILESTGGWTEAAYDLSGFAGSQVEVSITYVTDPSTGGVGTFVDDTRVVIDGAEDADGFEGATSVWTPGGPPAGSPPNAGAWEIGGVLFESFAGTSTEDTLLLGFGLEQLSTDEERADLVGRALDGLID